MPSDSDGRPSDMHPWSCRFLYSLWGSCRLFPEAPSHLYSCWSRGTSDSFPSYTPSVPPRSHPRFRELPYTHRPVSRWDRLLPGCRLPPAPLSQNHRSHLCRKQCIRRSRGGRSCRYSHSRAPLPDHRAVFLRSRGPKLRLLFLHRRNCQVYRQEKSMSVRPHRR